MDIDLRHAPSSTVARCVLAGGECLDVEGGSMVACSADMHVEASTPGGFLGGLKRAALSDGSYFVTTYTAPSGAAGSTSPVTFRETPSRFPSRPARISIWGRERGSRIRRV
nr:AIM24 family protein [Rhodococcus sp. P1Y]